MKKLTPATAKTLNQICKLPRDNVGGRNWWTIIDVGHVVMCQQKKGEEPTGKVEMSRRDFERLCKWYMTGVWDKPSRRAKAEGGAR
jgi:hypothetical protein